MKCARPTCSSATSARPRCSPRSGALGETTLHAFPPDQIHARQPRADRRSDLGSGSPKRRRARRAWVEDKFDGIRAQLHLGGGRVEIFTRDLRRVTEQFADLARAARALPREVDSRRRNPRLRGRAASSLSSICKSGSAAKPSDDLFLGASDVPVHLQGLRSALARRRFAAQAAAARAARSCWKSSRFRRGLELAPIVRGRLRGRDRSRLPRRARSAATKASSSKTARASTRPAGAGSPG